MVPGREPFGKEAFAEGSRQLAGLKIDGSSEIVELKIQDDWAWIRTRIKVTITPPTGKPNVRSGYTLTILRKNVDGAWVLARDANLLAPESGGSPAPQPS